MADNYQNDIYLGLLEKLGPSQSLILIDKLVIDLRNTRRGLLAAQSAKAADMLHEPSHVLISLAGVVGANDLYALAKEINENSSLGVSSFPSKIVQAVLLDLDKWLDFLKTDKEERALAV